MNEYHNERRGLMKKFKFLTLLILIIAVLTVGCKKDEEAAQPDVKDPVDVVDEIDEDVSAQVLKDFNELLAGTKDPADLTAFMDENMDKVSTLEGDIMVETLESKMEIYIKELQTKLSEVDMGHLMDITGAKEYFPVNRIDEIKDKKAKEIVDYIYKNKYKLINLEGTLEPIIDYKGLEGYGASVSELWQDYFSLKSMDSEKRAFSDGALSISFDELAERILESERYLNTYVDTPRRDGLIDDYKNKLTAYLTGLPNTKIVGQGNKILDDVLASYKETATMEGYVTGSVVGDYVKVIEDNKLIIDSKVLSFAESIINESVRMLNEFK